MSKLRATQNEIAKLTGELRIVQSVEDLRKLCNYPVWGLVVRLIVRTRSYDAGLEGAERLAQLLNQHRPSLNKEEWEEFYQSIHGFKLLMLDKLDFWEEYLETWEYLRLNTEFTLHYRKPDESTFKTLINSDDNASPQSEWGKRAKFILKVEENSILLHWLYTHYSRFEVISREITRSRNGKLQKTDRHHAQLDLSETELRRRLIEFEKFVQTVLREE